MTLWKDKVTLQKVGVTSWKDRINMDNTMKEKCPQGVCSGEGEYIIHLACSYGNDLDMYPATTAENSTACEEHESTRRAGAKNVILLPENVNRLMGL